MSLIYLKNDITGDTLNSKAKIIKLKSLENISFHISPSLDSADWSKEPKESLQEIYKLRAQQIRDSYDYVVFYFSGGSDSITALNAFMKNNIKIDEIVIYMNTDTTDIKINGLYALRYLENNSYKGFVNVKNLKYNILNEIVEKETWKKYEYFSGLISSIYRWRLDFLENEGYFEAPIRNGKVAHIFSGLFPKIVKEKNNYYSEFNIKQIMHSDANPTNIQFFTSENMPEIHIKQSHVLARAVSKLGLENEKTESAKHKLAIRDEYNFAVSDNKNYGTTKEIKKYSSHSIIVELYFNKPDFIRSYQKILDYFNSFETPDLTSFNKKYFLFSE